MNAPEGVSGHSVQVHIDGVPFYNFLAEAMDRAEDRIWGAISFIQPGFCFPDGRTLWEIVAAATSRGVNVRLLFWHNPQFPSAHMFSDTARNRAMLSEQAPGVLARWDHSPSASHCHHQKFWIVDQIGMIGGMVLSQSTLATPSHDPPNKHDIFASFQGPLLPDLSAHFSLRWAHAGGEEEEQQPVREPVGEIAGDVRISLARTQAPGLYGDEEGVSEIWEAYLGAIDRAQEFIYIENQHPGEERVLRALGRALERGVEVFYLVPGEPMPAIFAERLQHERARLEKIPRTRYSDTFDALLELGDHENFTLAKLVANGHEIYVHAKICIIDGTWMTIGSANLVDLSMCRDHTELNLIVHDGEVIRDTLQRLASEHTHDAVDHMISCTREGITMMARIARENTTSRSPTGHIHALEVATYALSPGEVERT